MSLTRRDVIKAGVFAGAAMSLPLSRVVSGQSALDSRMAASKLPKPFTTPFAYPPVAVPVRTDDTTDYYAMHMMPTQVEIVPGYQTLMFGYEGSVPGSDHQGPSGPQDGGAQLQPAADHASDVRLPAVHLGAPARLGLAAAVRRLRERHHATRTSSRTTSIRTGKRRERCGTTIMACTTPPRTCTTGLYGQYHITDDLEQSLPIPHGVYDVPLIIGDAMFKNDGQLLFTLEDDNGLWGDVITVNGRPWPVMQVERRKYRFRILAADGFALVQAVARLR